MLHTNNPVIKHKVGLLNLAEELSNVSNACKIMDVSRAVIGYAVAFPTHGQHRTSNELCKQGVFISGSGVRSPNKSTPRS
jgi:hypothetical protein